MSDALQYHEFTPPRRLRQHIPLERRAARVDAGDDLLPHLVSLASRGNEETSVGGLARRAHLSVVGCTPGELLGRDAELTGAFLVDLKPHHG